MTTPFIGATMRVNDSTVSAANAPPAPMPASRPPAPHAAFALSRLARAASVVEHHPRNEAAAEQFSVAPPLNSACARRRPPSPPRRCAPAPPAGRRRAAPLKIAIVEHRHILPALDGIADIGADLPDCRRDSCGQRHRHPRLQVPGPTTRCVTACAASTADTETARRSALVLYDLTTAAAATAIRRCS
jgi:hypothetical protein